MSFIWPAMLLSLLLVPLFVGFYIRLLRRRSRARAELGPLGFVENQSGRGPSWRRHIPPAIFLLGLIILLVGLARPELVVSLPQVQGTVILAFDVSNSMTAEDLEPTRIEAAKRAALTFVENQPSTIDIGVVAFSNGGLVVQPPTDQRIEILDAIDRLSVQGGTSLGQGIFTSLNAIAGETITLDEVALEDGASALKIEDYSSGVVVLLSDGENTEAPDPLEVAQLAAEAGVRIYPIGIGSPEGTVLQIEGFQILSQLDDATLKEIASLTNGAYHQATDSDALQEIYQNIDLKLTVQGEKTEVTALFAGLAALLFLLAGGVSLLWFGRLP